MKQEGRVLSADAHQAYGRAARFVRRAFDAAINAKRFYYPTPEQAMFRVIDHIGRTQALGSRFLTDEQRAAALDAMYGMVLELQGLESKGDAAPHPYEVPSGSASDVHFTGEVVASGNGRRTAAADWTEEPWSRHPRPSTDTPAHFRDPAEVLARRKIGRDKPQRPLFLPHEDRRFVLNGQHSYMDWLRREERRLGMDRTA